MTSTPTIAGRDDYAGDRTQGPYQKVVAVLQNNIGTDIDSDTPLDVHDSEGSTGDNVLEGTITKQSVVNFNQESMLNEILKQLKIMNIHLSILTDNDIKKSEVN